MNRKRTVKLKESDLKKMINESIKKILKEDNSMGMGVDEFKKGLYNDFYETLLNLYEETINEFCSDDDTAGYEEVFMDSAEEMATLTAKEFTENAITLLNSKNWNVPQSNFRPLNFVMGEQGIHNFQELLAQPNPVELFTDWFWSAYGTWGVKYNFQEFLSDEWYEITREDMNESRVIKENYNPVQTGIMDFHSDMNALRSDLDEIIDGLYDRNVRERLRMIDKKLAQIGAEFAKIEPTLGFLGKQNR